MDQPNDRRNIGVNFLPSGQASVRLWSPTSCRVDLVLSPSGDRLALQQAAEGYWSVETDALRPGDDYRFSIDEQDPLPDPASLSQRDGVHGASTAVDLERYNWEHRGWKNPALAKYVLYELHIGTFTPEGTFDAAAAKLDHLVALGITAIEIMPVAQFPGDRNWGYDGVFPFAVQDSYGGVAGLRRLVDRCHQKGLAVVLDVVYNHLGPEGNYFGSFGPYFTSKYNTPWGMAINFDDAWCDGVREYYIENALMWFRDFHIDALRLDAVHAIKDFSPVHILQEISTRVAELMSRTGCQYHLIAELDLNDTRFINPRAEGGYGMDAQWIDEFHHALRVSTGEPRTGYYEDFDGIHHLAKAYRDAYVYDGQFSPHRKKKFGVKASTNPGCQFVIFSQNHDQVGNRMLGERTSTLHNFETQKLLAGAVLTAPYVPMLFMGEEWGEPHPFQYFISHTDADLVEAVRKGRREEFAAFHAEGQAPDPAGMETFMNSKLQWSLLETGQHQVMYRFYQALIHLRKNNPVLCHLNRKQQKVFVDADRKTLLIHRWHEGLQLVCLFNYSDIVQEISLLPMEVPAWHKVFDSASPEWDGPGEAPGQLSFVQASRKSVPVQPTSFLIYANTHV